MAQWVNQEAKSHVNEVRSVCAASAASKPAIKQPLEATKTFLGVEVERDWLQPYSQAANRLAFL